MTYYRVRNNGLPPSGNYSSWAEVHFFDAGGAEILLNTYVASSNYDSQYYGPDKAADNNLATFWISANGDASASWRGATVSASPPAMATVKLTSSPNNGEQGRSATSFYIESSEDAATWTLIKAFTTEPWGISETRTFTMADTPPAAVVPRVLQQSVVAMTADNRPRVYEQAAIAMTAQPVDAIVAQMAIVALCYEPPYKDPVRGVKLPPYVFQGTPFYIRKK